MPAKVRLDVPRLRHQQAGAILVVGILALGCAPLAPKKEELNRRGGASAGSPAPEVSGSDTALAGFPRKACGDQPLPAAAVRRLSASEYAGTINSLAQVQQSWPLTKDSITSGYDHLWRDTTVSKHHAADFMSHAIKAAKLIVDGPLKSHISGCGGTASCLATLRQTVLERIFRRPLTGSELSRYASLAQQGSPAEGLQRMIAVALFSPHFLYRTELGPADGQTVRLSAHEIASQLAYSLTGAPPDATLRKLADEGQLRLASVRRQQAERLMGSQETPSYFSRTFARQWLEIADAPPSGTPTERFTAAQQELTAFSQRMISSDAAAKSWLTSQTTKVNGTLAAAYQLKAPPAGTWHEVTDAKRTGVLSAAAFTMSHSEQAESSPIKRGAVVGKKLLCKTLPPPPPGIRVDGVAADHEGQTTRQKVEQHVNNALCAGCHKHFDSFGFALESYDGHGQYRRTERGMTIDTTVSYLKSTDQYMTVDSLGGMMTAITAEPSYYSCLQHNLSTYFEGQNHLADACLISGDEVTNWQTRSYRAQVLDIISGERFVTRRLSR